MIKKMLITLGALAVTIAAVTFLYLETAVRRGIEIAASNALGTQVTVSGVSLSPLSGRGSIRELRVANPEGFNTPHAIELDSLDFEVNLDTVFSDVIEIRTIVVNDVSVAYETRLVTDNIRTLIANIPATRETEPAPADTPEGKRVVIRDFQMIDPRINIYALVGSAPIALPDLHLQNIGDPAQPSTIPQAAREILDALYRSLVFAGIPSLTVIGEEIGEQLKEGASRVGDAVEDVADGLRDLFRN